MSSSKDHKRTTKTNIRDNIYPYHPPYTPLTLDERRQNKILLLLSLSSQSSSSYTIKFSNVSSIIYKISQSRHFRCESCDLYYNSRNYIQFSLFLLKSGLYPMSYLDTHINCIIEPTTSYINHCVFCVNMVDKTLSKFLFNFHLSLKKSTKIPLHISLNKYFQEKEEDLIQRDSLTVSSYNGTCFIPINLTFHRCLYLLSKALPLDIYYLYIDNKPYQSYSRYDWFHFYKSKPTEILFSVRSPIDDDQSCLYNNFLFNIRSEDGLSHTINSCVSYK